MAVAGIAGGFFMAWRGADSRRVRLRAGRGGGGGRGRAVVGEPGVWRCWWRVATGAALGVATVGLAAMLPGWCGVAWVGLGTGLGYAFCNLPVVFTRASGGAGMDRGGHSRVRALRRCPSEREWRRRG